MAKTDHFSQRLYSIGKKISKILLQSWVAIFWPIIIVIVYVLGAPYIETEALVWRKSCIILLLFSVGYLIYLSFFLFKEARVIQALIVSIFLLAYLGIIITFSPIVHWGHQVHNKKVRMQQPEVFCPVAESLVNHCLQLEDPVHYDRLSAHFADKSVLPSPIRELDPTRGEIAPTGAGFQMHCGFDHFGYRLEIEDPPSTGAGRTWRLYYYDENKEVLLKTDTIPGASKASPMETENRTAVAVSEG